ncbi:MAG: (2Fe-2S)-binding protein [Ruminococcaceae bacterium]|nr:(2Fe-2S)-binding protein [Oscillospiraceae bacterium]MBQ9912594.1 (2Fe-2S)-binding protein [Clostridia bacterium]
MFDYMICSCKKVSFFDVEDALNKFTKFEDVEKAFKEVQEITHCSTGCGGCHDKIIDAISEIMTKNRPYKA